MLGGSSAALFNVGAPAAAAKLLMLPSPQLASVWPVFLLNKSPARSSALFSSFPSSSLPSQPEDVCWFVHVVSLTLSPRSEARCRRVGTGGEALAGVTDELKSTRLVLKLAPWGGSSLVSMAIKAVSTCGPSVRLLKPNWWEVNPRNTSVLGSECILMDVNRQDEGKSAHLCLWFNVDLPATSFSSSSLVTPPPPLSLIPIPDEAVWLTTNFFLYWHTTSND